MRRILLDRSQPAYLNPKAAAWLEDARKTAHDAGLDSGDWFSSTDSHSYWFTWTGTRTHETLQLMAQLAGMPAEDQAGIALLFRALPADAMHMLKSTPQRPPTAIELAAKISQKLKRKYDLLSQR